MLSALVPLFLPSPPKTVLWWLGGTFLAYAVLTLAWTVSPNSTVHALWKLALYGAVIVTGASLSERGLRAVCLAFALGMCVSGAIAVFQVMGMNPSYGGYSIVQVAPPSGLFVNRNGMAEAGLLAVIICFRYRMWWLLPLCLVAAFLPMSKGVIMAALIALGVVYLRNRWAVMVLSAGAFSIVIGKLVLSAGTQSVDGRLAVWLDTLTGLRWFGYGGGTFDAAYPSFADRSTNLFFSFNMLPGTPHSDVLLLLSAYGLGAFLLFAFVLIIFWKGRYEPLAPVVAAFLAMGLVDFPFEQAAPSFIACLCLGGLLRAGLGLRDSSLGSGDRVYRGHEYP